MWSGRVTNEVDEGWGDSVRDGGEKSMGVSNLGNIIKEWKYGKNIIL